MLGDRHNMIVKHSFVVALIIKSFAKNKMISKTIDVKTIIDNNKRGQQFCGIDICFSEEVEDKGQLVIITVSREQKTVESDLLKHGFENYISLDRLMTEWSDSRGL